MDEATGAALRATLKLSIDQGVSKAVVEAGMRNTQQSWCAWVAIEKRLPAGFRFAALEQGTVSLAIHELIAGVDVQGILDGRNAPVTLLPVAQGFMRDLKIGNHSVGVRLFCDCGRVAGGIPSQYHH